LTAPADAVYADLLVAMTTAGVQIATSDPAIRIATGSATSPSMTTGDKPLAVTARVEPDGDGAAVRITATVQQAIDYGATERLLRRIETELARSRPGVTLDISVVKP
jgi:hypothetical protein